MFALARRGRHSVNVWPAFVDLLASVLLVLVFMLLVFVLGQFVLSTTLFSRDRAIDELGRQVSALSDTLAMERARAAALEQELQATLSRLEERTDEARVANDSIGLLNQQVAALREQLERLNAALEASEAKFTSSQQELAASEERLAAAEERLGASEEKLAASEERLAASRRRIGEQQAEIDLLGERLNLALAKKAEELQRYRSEFFGRMRELLGEHPSIRIVGDRFVFQSELLFPTASAQLQPEGRDRLAELARTLREVTRNIPPDIEWVLRIDGHTDRRPIRTPEFASNWELSTARALSVLRFLEAHGIPPQHLAATGFAEYHPIDPGEGEAAYARNRRIEIKLTPP